MLNGAQQQILDMLRSRRMVMSREFIRECSGWDFRKALCRLRKKYPITNVAKPGHEGCWVWVDKDK
jgi:hypothetical protein